MEETFFEIEYCDDCDKELDECQCEYCDTCNGNIDYNNCSCQICEDCGANIDAGEECECDE